MYTEGNAITNHLPFLPMLVSPTIHSIVNTSTVLLEWSGSDVDNDQLTYDVYFGESPTPIKIETYISKNHLQIAINPNTSYYWRVDTIDSKGAKTIGKIWEFSTK